MHRNIPFGASLAVAAILITGCGGSKQADPPAGQAVETPAASAARAPDVSAERLMAHVRALSSDEFAGRLPGTVGEEKAQNIHVGGGKSREDFIRFRTERDAQLAVPKLIIPSLQVNMRAGEVPTDPAGNPVLKVPVNGL